MYDAGMTATETEQTVGCSNQYDEGKENEQVAVGEEVDELRDGVVRRDGTQHLTLTHPPDGELVTCHLDPHGVDAVLRNDIDVGHHQAVVRLDEQRVALVGNERQRVGIHHEIVALGVMMGGGEGNAVNLLLRQVPGIRCLLAVVVTGCAQQQKAKG